VVVCLNMSSWTLCVISLEVFWFLPWFGVLIWWWMVIESRLLACSSWQSVLSSEGTVLHANLVAPCDSQCIYSIYMYILIYWFVFNFPSLQPASCGRGIAHCKPSACLCAHRHPGKWGTQIDPFSRKLFTSSRGNMQHFWSGSIFLQFIS